MKLIGNKLTPDDGMHLKLLSDGTVYDNEIYIPSTLSPQAFTEITHVEYERLTGDYSVDKELIDVTEYAVNLEAQLSQAQIDNQF